jgi:hypothetical protein
MQWVAATDDCKCESCTMRIATRGLCSRRCKLPHVCSLVVSLGDLQKVAILRRTIFAQNPHVGALVQNLTTRAIYAQKAQLLRKSNNLILNNFPIFNVDASEISKKLQMTKAWTFIAQLYCQLSPINLNNRSTSRQEYLQQHLFAYATDVYSTWYAQTEVELTQ